jgi:hypothetical protein
MAFLPRLRNTLGVTVKWVRGAMDHLVRALVEAGDSVRVITMIDFVEKLAVNTAGSDIRFVISVSQYTKANPMFLSRAGMHSLTREGAILRPDRCHCYDLLQQA